MAVLIVLAPQAATLMAQAALSTIALVYRKYWQEEGRAQVEQKARGPD